MAPPRLLARAAAAATGRRLASSSSAAPSSSSAAAPPSAAKTVVLAKPAKFNPPSHGARLRGNVLPRHYAPALTPAEKAAQKVREYPGLMPPEGTLAHRIWTHRMLHVFITMGILLGLGVFTFFLNYVHHSPFKHLVPPLSDLWNEPARFFSAWKNVVVLHEKDKSEKAYQHRMRSLDDVAKRKLFMKMHGLEPKDPVLMVLGKGDKMWPDHEPTAVEAGLDAAHDPEAPEKPAQRKRWFGIF